ncbi:MAG: DUF2797 domain-containing protein [Bacteriovoracaceae bacterium]|nr:DUF2797 domain-containing protein [Bacteriovoracaceae bacterium]
MSSFYQFIIKKLNGSLPQFSPELIFTKDTATFLAKYEWDAEAQIPISQFLHQKITLRPTGKIFCIASGEKIKKTYNQGYSYKSFISLPECDICMVRPELCHYAKGTCRDSSWGESHCLRPHIIYLANTGDIKIGITRNTNYPTRWVDQGASQVIPLVSVKDRLTAGLVEMELAKKYSDKTKWQKMLSPFSLNEKMEEIKTNILNEFQDLFDLHHAERLPNFIININYPVENYPTKIKSFTLDEKNEVSGALLGIKGQYLIFETGVLNVRKFQGYEVDLEIG